MKILLSWLKNYVDLELPPQQIAKALTLAGIEVDSIESVGSGFKKVVVAKVLEVSPHPNAEMLVVAKVTDGVEEYQIVCGDTKCRAGMKTALALIGAELTLPKEGEKGELSTLTETVKIKKTKLRGVDSYGMLCSASELGIASESDGIIEFAESMKVGSDVAALYSDTIFELSFTPNLNYAASVIGVAKELSAITGAKFKTPNHPKVLENPSWKISDEVTLSLLDTKDVGKFSLRLVKGLKDKVTPEWMAKRLLASGIRPIHLAVDVTNYVLLETGQPLHAFDFDSINPKEIIVRKALKGESLLTLDGKLRTLNESMVVVADGKKALSIAGIMGGKHSEVTSHTSRVLLEAAYFTPEVIRKGSKTLGLISDSSKKFERGIDPNGVLIALDRAAALLQEIAGAEVATGILLEETKKFEPKKITCRVSRVNQILGTKLSLSEVESAFNRLSFKVENEGEEALLVTVPTYRVDVLQEIDLIEEVARIIGYDNIPRQPSKFSSSTIKHTPLFEFEREVRERLIGTGLQEFLNCDLIGDALLAIAKDPKTPEKSVVKVLNPVSIEQSVLRTSLLQGLLQNVKHNADRESQDIAAFEVGRVHFKVDDYYLEPSVVGIVLSGQSRPYHFDPKPHPFDFLDLKGMIENLLIGLNIKRFTFRPSKLEIFHPGRQALIQVDGVDVGSLGEIHPNVQRKMDVAKRVFFAELSLSDLLLAKRAELQMRPLAVYPASKRDLTVTVEENLPFLQVLSAFQHIPSPLLERVSLVDIFRSEKLGPYLKNVTLNFVYRDKEKTVAQEEVDKEHARIVESAIKLLNQKS